MGQQAEEQPIQQSPNRELANDIARAEEQVVSVEDTEYGGQIGGLVLTVLDFFSTLFSGPAKSGSLTATQSPSPVGVAGSLIYPGAQVTAEGFISNYLVSNQERQMFILYADGLAGGEYTIEEAVNFMHGTQYLPGIENDIISQAFEDYVR